MSRRSRFLAIFALGLTAAVGAGYAALEPLREADAAALDLWGEIGSLRDGVAALEPGAAGDPAAGAASRAELLGRLDRAEREFSARRESIVRIAVFHLSFALAAATAAFWAAVTLASRSGARAGAAAPQAGASDAERLPSTISFVAGPDGSLRSVSEALAKELGRKRDAFLGEPAAMLFVESVRSAVESLIISIGPAKPSGKLDVTLCRGDPAKKLRLRLHARFDEAGLVSAIEGEGREPTAAAAEGEKAAPAHGARGAPRARRGRAESSPPAPPPRPDSARLAGAEILVALRNPDERRLVAFLLGQVGARVTTVPDGDALLSAVEGERAQPFEALVLEPQLPGFDGLAARRQLLQRGIAVPVIALIPSGDPRLAAACLESGCARTVSTPVDRRALVAALVAALPERDRTRPVLPELASTPPEVAPAPAELAPAPAELAPAPMELAPAPPELEPAPPEREPAPPEREPAPPELDPTR